MILIIESDITIRKKLSDLLSKERIIGTDSMQQMLEMICKFKNEVNVIVADIHQFHEIISKKVIFRLCERFHIDAPPIIGVYKKVMKVSRKNSKRIISDISFLNIITKIAGSQSYILKQ